MLTSIHAISVAIASLLLSDHATIHPTQFRLLTILMWLSSMTGLKIFRFYYLKEITLVFI